MRGSSLFGLSWKVPYLLQSCFPVTLCGIYAKCSQRPMLDLEARQEVLRVKGHFILCGPPGLEPLQVCGVSPCSSGPLSRAGGWQRGGESPRLRLPSPNRASWDAETTWRVRTLGRDLDSIPNLITSLAKVSSPLCALVSPSVK